MIRAAPWDSAAFGMPAWELTEYSEAALRHADGVPGHQSLKLDPLADTALLQRHRFHYCGTLLAVSATPARLGQHAAPDGLTIGAPIERAALQSMCREAFVHGRFHRDFTVPKPAAELRYRNWFDQLLDAGTVFTLYAQAQPAGFIAYSGNQLVLHAVAPAFRGRGMARHWWRLAIARLFAAGHAEVGSSIAAANLAAVNLYASLGFSFHQPQDCYHRLIP